MIEDLIYDVGMNNGDDTRHYLAKGFRVIAIEANPQLVEIASRELSEFISSQQLTILNLGIAEKECTLDFWVNRKHQWSSFDPQLGRRDDPNAYSISVGCQPLVSLFNRYGIPFYLKLDIEGFDLIALDALDPADLPHFVSVEADGTGVARKLAGLGYRHFKLIDQFTHFPMDEPLDWELALFLALGETRRSPTPFPFGSSGPFGMELPGRWRSLEKIVHAWEYHRDLQRRHPTHRRAHWCDFHAALHVPDASPESSATVYDPNETLHLLIHSVSGLLENERNLAEKYRQWAERSDGWLVSERLMTQELRERVKALEAQVQAAKEDRPRASDAPPDGIAEVEPLEE
jgi:FkbM family methyltransferase